MTQVTNDFLIGVLNAACGDELKKWLLQHFAVPVPVILQKDVVLPGVVVNPSVPPRLPMPTKKDAAPAQLKAPAMPDGDKDQWVCVQTVAKLTGYSVAQVYMMVTKYRWQKKKVGLRAYFLRSEVLKFKKGTVLPQPLLDSESIGERYDKVKANGIETIIPPVLHPEADLSRVAGPCKVTSFGGREPDEQ